MLSLRVSMPCECCSCLQCRLEQKTRSVSSCSILHTLGRVRAGGVPLNASSPVLTLRGSRDLYRMLRRRFPFPTKNGRAIAGIFPPARIPFLKSP